MSMESRPPAIVLEAFVPNHETLMKCLDDSDLHGMRRYLAYHMFEEHKCLHYRLLWFLLQEVLKPIDSDFKRSIGRPLSDCFFNRETRFSLITPGLELEETSFGMLRALWFAASDASRDGKTVPELLPSWMFEEIREAKAYVNYMLKERAALGRETC